jgi:hypothetical protein
MNSGQLRTGFGHSASASAEKVAAKKLDFVCDHGLMGWSVVDVEMIDTWIDAEFTFWSPSCCVNCWPRLGNLIATRQ